jgi:hypothetical protein
MPYFKTNYDIFVNPESCESYSENWMDRDTVYLPPYQKWDYARELNVDDISLWEVIYEAGGGLGLYAAWDPHAEFYLLTTGNDYRYRKFIYSKDGVERSCDSKNYETFYGKNCQKTLLQKIKQYNIPISINKVWVDNDDMWLYEDQNVYMPNLN